MQSKLCKFWHSSNAHYFSEILFSDGHIIFANIFVIFLTFCCIHKFPVLKKILKTNFNYQDTIILIFNE